MKQTDDMEFAERMQSQYDVTNEKTQIFHALAEKIGDRRFNSTLDIGCGPGDITTALSRASDELTLVDITPSYAETLQKKFPDAKVITADFHDLTFEKQFDAVL